MGLLEEWQKVRNGNPKDARKFALSNNRPGVTPKTAFANDKPQDNRLPESVIADVVKRNTKGTTDDRRDNAMSRRVQGPYGEPGGIGNQAPIYTPPPKSILEVLMEKLGEQYQGPDPSKMDFTALDKALESRMGMLNGARDRIRGNAAESDKNLAGMHGAFENQVRTDDAARYNQISDQQKGNLNANTQQGIGMMEAARARAVAERQAMLKNLGQEQAAGAEDPGAETLNRGVQVLNERNTTNQNLADNQRATNLSYNNTVAQSIGQQGVARRAALQQQLAGLLGKVDMAEQEAKAQNEIERQRAVSGQSDQGYKMWNDNQNRMAGLFDTLSGQELQREKMGMAPQERPRGIQSVAADLENTGADPAMASQGMAALAEILGSGNYLNGANGADGNTPYDRVNILTQRLREKNVDPQVALAIATSYGNL